MTITHCQIRTGVYYDSVILMQLQRTLTGLPGIIDAGVVMGTQANKDMLAQSGLWAAEVQDAKTDDLVIVLRARDEVAAQVALEQIDQLLASRRRAGGAEDYRPKTLESAVKMLPEAQWVLISVPGRYAAGVAREALHMNKHVFLYSDNVSQEEDEAALKELAAQKGLLVMGPDCGTAIVNGVGLGFANQVRRGSVGIVAASGTGLQQVSSRIHQLGMGITHAIGTGGRDLSEAVGAVTASQGLDLLQRDPDTQAIVLISKPSSKRVADELVNAARKTEKPVVVNFIGHPITIRTVDNVQFATTFDETAALAVQLAIAEKNPESELKLDVTCFASGQRYLRGLFSGGTLAYEALLILQDYLPAVYSNAPLDKTYRLRDSLTSQEHTIIDLGEDEFTVGRLHPMMDNDLRIRRLEKEADDPEVAIILLDVVLGHGAHPDPAGELAPVIAVARQKAQKTGRHLVVITIVVGTDEDPQDLGAQVEKLEASGAMVTLSNEWAVRYAGRLASALNLQPDLKKINPVDLSAFTQPLSAINVGLESFAESLKSQGAAVIQMDWRPPASGNEKLMALLERMKGSK